jgi:hypothetical protein
VVFQDTFSYDANDKEPLTMDVNANLVIRQAGGILNARYTKTGSSKGYLLKGSGTESDALVARVYQTETPQNEIFDIDRDFGASLGGQKWALMYKGRMTSTDRKINAWSGFSVGHPANTPKNSGTGGFGFVLFNTGAYQVWSGNTKLISGVVDKSICGAEYDLKAVFDEIAGTVSLSITVATSTDPYELGTYPVSFIDGSRYVEFMVLVNGNASIQPDQYIEMHWDDIKLETFSN